MERIITKEDCNKYHPCFYEGLKCIYPSDDVPPFEQYVFWLDKYGHIEKARMKEDAEDHFYPNTKLIKEEDIIAWTPCESEEILEGI